MATLSIGRLAEYVGVTPRAIRHYHALGLLPEPERTASGYRSYRAEDVIDLQRIKVLTDAGVPLARVRELMDADPAALRAAVAELDAELAGRISALRRTRRSLAALANGEDPFLSPRLAAVHARMRELGVSEHTLAADRDGWILVQALYPDLIESWAAAQHDMFDDPGYRELYLLTDQAQNWTPDDPRIEELAQRTIAWVRGLYARAEQVETEGWVVDSTAYRLVTNYRRDSSPGWRRFMERVEELAAEVDPGSGVF
ncbi:MAG: MerR family transcriptional regulator [Propionicimonas sp.]